MLPDDKSLALQYIWVYFMQCASYKNNVSILYYSEPLLYTMYIATLGNAAASFNCFTTFNYS